MTVPSLDITLPRNGDATHHRETRDNFAALQHLLGLGPTLAVTGANAAATDLNPALYGRFELTTDAAVGANDFDLMVPAAVGQTVVILLALKNTQNATITEKSGGSEIVTAAGAAVASITLDATDEFAVLRAIDDSRWMIVGTSGTVA